MHSSINGILPWQKSLEKKVLDEGWNKSEAVKSQLKGQCQYTTEFLFSGDKMIIMKANCEDFTKLNNNFNSNIMPFIPLVLKWTISSERIVNDSFFFQALSWNKIQSYQSQPNLLKLGSKIVLVL